jgi:hypothetical protein
VINAKALHAFSFLSTHVIACYKFLKYVYTFSTCACSNKTTTYAYKNKMTGQKISFIFNSLSLTFDIYYLTNEFFFYTWFIPFYFADVWRRCRTLYCSTFVEKLLFISSVFSHVLNIYMRSDKRCFYYINLGNFQNYFCVYK